MRACAMAVKRTDGDGIRYSMMNITVIRLRNLICRSQKEKTDAEKTTAYATDLLDNACDGRLDWNRDDA